MALVTSAFATHQPWARRHAEATEVRGGFHALVPRKRPENAGRAVRAFLKPGT